MSDHYPTPGPFTEGRTVNADLPESVGPVVLLDDALRQLDRLKTDCPDGRFYVERRTVWVEPWEPYAGDRP